jgi:hypothetical protein
MSQAWIEPELPEARYHEILDYETPESQMNYIPVWTIRSPMSQPDARAGRKKSVGK